MALATNGEFGKLVAVAIAHHEAGRLAEAETAYRAALVISPAHAITRHNLGALVAAQGKHISAIALFDKVIAAEPDYATAHYNRAMALHTLGRLREAIRGFSRASVLEPGHYDAHRALGFLLLAEGERGRALDHFARTYELRRGDDRTGIAEKSLTFATRSKLLHDSEQFRYLSPRRRDNQNFETLAHAYEDVADDFPDQATRLSERQLKTLGDNYNTAINVYGAPELGGRAVSEIPERDAVTRQFAEGESGAVVLDDLLTPPALLGLRRYLLESTIWHDFGYIDRFVASYLEDGLACPLLLQIADELRKALPDLLANLPLTQAWAFKGLAARATIDAHADDAAITINFWVTPDAANLKPGGGGLAVCRVPPPVSWQVEGYDAGRDEAVAFLGQHAAETLSVPYRENRAVMFRSRLLHRSDVPEFKIGYENHRINVAFLFGHHDQAGYN